MRFSNYSSFMHDLGCHGLEYAAARSVRLGYVAVELCGVYPAAQSLARRFDHAEFKATLDRHGLAVSCYSIYADLLNGERDEVLAALREHIEFAAHIGAPYFHHTIAPNAKWNGTPVTYDEVFPYLVDLCKTIARMAKEYGITCLYEPQGPFVNGVEGVSRILFAVKAECDNVAVCGDVGNPVFADADPVPIFETLTDYIPHLHVKDYTVSETPLDNGLREFHSVGGRCIYDAPIGTGCIDIAGCFAPVAARGPLPYVSIEVFSEDDSVHTDAMAYLNALEKTL